MAYISFQPSDYFNTKLHTGTGSTASITGVGFQPDMVWSKQRNGTDNHNIIDAVRGVTKILQTDTTAVEQTASQSLTSFDSDGFSVGTDNAWNGSSNTYCMWNWKANGQGSSNTDGSITSTVSASTTSGFSIVTWTGNSGSIGHGLGKKPAMLITKSLGATGGWYVTHKSLSAEMQDNYMFLNDTSANSTNNDIWGGEPTTSTFSVGSGLIGNTTHVAYCFAPIKGFSAMGSYTGNGNADGAFIYTGFKPAFVMYKNSSVSGGHWQIYDNKRLGYNGANKVLRANLTNAEADDEIDLLSNGFKCRATNNNNNNHSGVTYIYMAFSEESIVSSNGVPATAR